MEHVEAEYSAQIRAILTPIEWKKLCKAMKVLKYNSPGEFLRLFYEDEPIFLESNEYYVQSNFIKRKRHLMAGIPKFPITDWRPPIIRKFIYFRSQYVFLKLHKELTHREIMNLNNPTTDLDIKLIQYTKLSNYLIRRGYKYNFFLEEMALSLTERKLRDQETAEINQNSTYSQEEQPSSQNPAKLIVKPVDTNSINNLPIHGASPIFHYQLENIRKLNRLAKFLFTEGYIDNVESFICLFHRTDKRIDFKSKTIWGGHIIALIFLFKSLMIYGIVEDKRQIAKMLSNSFLNKDGVEIKSELINSLFRGPYKFIDMNTRDLATWVEKNGNKDIARIYRELRKIYFNDLDLLSK